MNIWTTLAIIAVVCAAIFFSIMAKGWYDDKRPRDYDDRMHDIFKGRHTYRTARKHVKSKSKRHA